MPDFKHDSLDHDTIDRYLADDLSTSELGVFLSVLDQQPELRAQINRMRVLVKHTDQSLSPYDAHARVEDIVAAACMVPQESTASSITGRTVRRTAAISFAVVAAFVVAVVINPFDISPRNDSAITLVTTEKGERSSIQLPDGTTVSLNVESQLKVPEDFLSNRRVELKGEAYFHVTHSAKNHFEVVTGDVTTKVLGTEFAVRSYPSEEVRVSVQSGKVSVADVVLEANSMARIYNRDSVSIVRNINLDHSFNFTSGNLSIDYLPLKSAAGDLSRWYNVDIQFADSAAQELRFSANLTSGSVTDLIEILEFTLPVKATLSGKKLTIAFFQIRY